MTNVDFRTLAFPLDVLDRRSTEHGGSPLANRIALLEREAWRLSASVVYFAAALILTPLLAAVIAAVVTGETITLGPELIAAVTLITIAIAVKAIFSILEYRVFRERWEAVARLSRFAASNGLRYSPIAPGAPLPGLIFDIGTHRSTRDQITLDDERFEIGTHSYRPTESKTQRSKTWSYMAIGLHRSLPHIVLDSTANNGLLGLSNLPTTLDRSQVLELEGDFNRHFTLYCPSGYERDALTILTPDFMALLIDESAPFDVEIVENWLFVYSNRPLQATDATSYQRLFRIAETVGVTAIRRTKRYVDDWASDRTIDLVSPRGRRLQPGAPSSIGLIATVVVAAVLLIRALG